MPHTKSLHNYQGVNLSASTKLSWQKKPEQINNPEQSAPRGAVWSGQPDCFFHHSRLAGRLHFRSHTLKDFFSKIYFGQIILHPCLFDLILLCVLLKDHNAVTPVMLKHPFFLEQLVSLFDFDSLHPINNLSVI